MPDILRVVSIVGAVVMMFNVDSALADDIRWTGNQSPGAYPVGQGSFHDGANWEYFAPPGPDNRVVFGSGYASAVNPTTSPRYIYFGDSVFSYPNTPNQSFIPGRTATVDIVDIQSGAWTFDFGGFGVSYVTSGGLSANQLILGTPSGGIGGVTGTTSLTVRGVAGIGYGLVDTSSIRIGATEGASGSLILEASAHVHSKDWSIGHAPSSMGTLKVGSGSDIFVQEHLQIGEYGSGRLDIHGGGTVWSANPIGYSVIGFHEGADGVVSVSGVGSEWTVREPLVGVYGNGTLHVQHRGQVNSLFLYVGADSGDGVVTVSNSGSQLNVSRSIIVGQYGGAGVGDVEVTNGAEVRSLHGFLEGGWRGSTVTISDIGSIWQVEREMKISGSHPGSACVNVTKGGLLSVGERLFLGTNSVVDVAITGKATIGSATPVLGAVVVGLGGTLGGTGTILGDLINDGGVIAPGFSPGKLRVVGNYLQGSLGSLDLEIGGLLPGQYDQLSVTGNALLAGTLNISFIDGFLPRVGDRFDLFQVGGSFDASAASFLWTNPPTGVDFRGEFRDGVYSVAVVPEPSTIFLLMSGAIFAGVNAIRRKRLLATGFRSRTAATILVFCATGPLAMAGTSHWNQPAFGVFEFGTSWVGGVPGPNDVAVLGSSIGTTVSPVRALLNVDADIHGAWVASGDYTFAFGNPNLTLTADRIVVGGSLWEFFQGIGRYAPPTLSSTATMQVHIVPFGYAGDVSTERVNVGAPPFANEPIRPGVLEVAGAGVKWTNSNSVQIGSIGNQGELRVLGGAEFINGYLTYVGGGSSRPWESKGPEIGSGTLAVSGFGSRYHAGLELLIGVDRFSGSPGFAPQQSTGQVSVTDWGTLEVDAFGVTHIGNSLRGSFPEEVAPSKIYVGYEAQAHLGRWVWMWDEDAVIEVRPNTTSNSFDGGTITIGEADYPEAGAIVVGYDGELSGIGTIVGKLINDGGFISPGLSPGTLHIVGDVLQSQNGQLNLEIGGLLPVEYDRLIVDGDLTLAGTVALRLINGFEPQIGDRFEIFHVGGSFDVSEAIFVVPSLSTGMHLRTTFTNGTYAFTVVPEPSTLALAVCAGLGFLSFGWRRLGRQTRAGEERPTHRSFVNAALATFTLLAGAEITHADDIRWTGNQSPGAYPVGQGSFHDGANWQYFAPPGASDRALLGTGLVTDVNPTTSPRYVYFGDAIFTYPNTPNQSFVPGGTASVASLAVQSGIWTFDFGTFGSFPAPEVVHGNLHVNGWLTVGGPAQDVSSQGASTTLNLRGPGEVRTGVIAAGASAGYAGTIDVRDGARMVSTEDDVLIGFFGNGTLNVSDVSSAEEVPNVETVHSIRVGILDGSQGSLIGNGGATLWAGQRLDVGVQAAAIGSVVLSGAGTELSTQGEIGIGYWGQGILEIQSGASAQTSSWMSIAVAQGSLGKVVVEGNGSQLIVTGPLNVGFGGDGLLSVRNHASVITQEAISVGDLADSHGELRVATGAIVQANALNLGEQAQSAGRVDISGGSLLDVAGIGRIGNHGHAEVRVATMATLQLSSLDAAIAPTATAEILVTGANSHLAIGSDARLGDEGAALLQVDDGGLASIASHLIINSNSEANVAQGGMATIGQATPISGAIVVGEDGLLSGAGTIVGDVVNDGGIVAPGLSPGTLRINGNYLQGPNGILNLEVGGVLAGEFDQLIVTGNLILAGTVNIHLVNGFLPAVGDQFNFFAIGGDFDISGAEIHWPNAPIGLRYSASYDDGVYSAVITAVPEPSTLVLAGMGMVAVALAGRRRQVNAVLRANAALFRPRGDL